MLCMLMCGCKRTMNEIIQEEPSIKGKVIERMESSFVMEDENGTQYVVSKGSGVQ